MLKSFEDMVDTIQTKEGAVAISAENMRSSMRSVRRGKTKLILTPASLASHVPFALFAFYFTPIIWSVKYRRKLQPCILSISL